MQRPDEKKRQLIAATAAKMFATRPFHKVKLDEVAAAAGVGKGTLYVYFKSKEDLYFWLIHDAFAKLVEQLSSQLADGALRSRERLGIDRTATAFDEAVRTVLGSRGRRPGQDA